MRHPLFFRFTDEIPTSEWAALVVACGQCLVSFEDDQWWTEGVQPGGVVASGLSAAGSTSNFRSAWTNLLHDFAKESRSFEEFKAAVERFFQQVSEPARVEWEAERREVTAEHRIPEAPFSSIARESGERPSHIDIREIGQPDTVQDDYLGESFTTAA